MDRRKLLIVLIFSLFAFNAAAQDSFSDLVGSDLTLEESLVQFVNSVTTFDVEGAPGVLLYVVTPLIGFYFLTLNFVSMGYELFEERIDRPAWNHSDDEIPTGMRGFAMIVSVITVLFLGTAGAGLLLFSGLGSLALAILMMTGLLNEGLGDGGEQQQQTQQPQQNQQQPQQQQGGGGSNWSDMFNAAANLFGTAQNTAQGLQQQQQQQMANQMQESLRYFENDMLDESGKFFSDFSNIRQLIEDAESEAKASDVDSDKFQSLNRRVADLNKVLREYKEKMSEDHAGAGSRVWNSSELKTFHDNLSPSLAERAEMIANQFQNVVTDAHVPPPDDKLRELTNHHLADLVAVGHFMTEAPHSMADLATDDSKAQEVVNVAKSMNVLEDRSGRDERQEIKMLCSKLENQDNPEILIEEAIAIAEKDLKIEDSEHRFFEKFLKNDGEIMTKVEDIGNGLSYYNTPSGSTSGLESQLTQVENFVSQAMNYSSGIESEINQNGKFENNLLKKLRELDSKI